jgi:hypothetical protein
MGESTKQYWSIEVSQRNFKLELHFHVAALESDNFAIPAIF